MLYLQDASYEKSMYLDEALTTYCKNSQEGGGAYAFVSINGVKLFLHHKEFIRFIKKGSFTLIIGMDAITNINT